MLFFEIHRTENFELEYGCKSVTPSVTLKTLRINSIQVILLLLRYLWT